MFDLVRERLGPRAALANLAGSYLVTLLTLSAEIGGVSPRWRGRLLGFERPGIQPPWLLERIERVLHRGTHEVEWDDVDWSSAT
ncbi:hypothetical protein ACFOWZ_38895 [Lentzea rhizosphaerae]|uniref:Uncharacterized protein n=1 Tax=Lentzea rhizosphaerae TaxID=2041025 RepID=A0ABV8C609_9PSEU